MCRATRRETLQRTVLGAGLLFRRPALADEPKRPQSAAAIAITLDLEMSRNFPQWETTHWDYEKGNLDDQAKKYTVEACRRVKQAGGVLHSFCVGRVLEQENVDWLKQIHAAGHPVGNHTYDHVNVTVDEPVQTQFRFQRSPWLVEGRTALQVIDDNIRLTTKALRSRLGIVNAGFRTPGGFDGGLTPHPVIQRLLLDQGFTWVSSQYPRHPIGPAPTAEITAGILDAQTRAQPFVYPTGLVEVPMSPISDIGAFRTGRWKVEDFVTVVRQAVRWAIERRAVFDFLAHPSCLGVVDPEFRTIDMILNEVQAAGSHAAIVGLDAVAQRLTTR